MGIKVKHPYKEKGRECDLCGHKWTLVYNVVKNPNWNPPYECPRCQLNIPQMIHFKPDLKIV